MYLITILVYLVIIVAIGILFKNQNRNIEDFALAGRKGLP
ncbi:hypothetical protein CathTA2_0856 [Caldalkalibacillus thermarum TA2.A1]|uniref:Uncharacterized protein n=1 Tax=Caldalkalibacillus thermarum (strain TA2.A1) TaxID=986075 RepID=F5L4Z3_CALTT|nr:hypothetical protein CathTA2_0856 [Caldalkalibacillus thermarum TA2.A1]